MVMKPDSSLLLTGGGDGKLKLWDPRMKKLLASSSFESSSERQQQPQGAVACLTFVGDDDSLVAMAATDGALNVYDTRMGSTLHLTGRLVEAVGGIHSIAAPSADTVAIGDGRGMLLVYDIKRMRLAYGLAACSSGPVKAISVFADRNKIATAGEDGNVLVYSYN
jgi:WD40 repeat protein